MHHVVQFCKSLLGNGGANTQSKKVQFGAEMVQEGGWNTNAHESTRIKMNPAGGERGGGGVENCAVGGMGAYIPS